MSIAPAILKQYSGLNDAGPGSGKTHSIFLRALNLLLLEKVEPKQLVLCTFTEIDNHLYRIGAEDARPSETHVAPVGTGTA